MKDLIKILLWFILIFLAMAGILAICVYFFPNAEAVEEPEWDKLAPIIIQIESGGNPNAISSAGCIGLMQISSMVLKEWNNEYKERSTDFKYYNLGDLYNPFVNVRIGTWYLKRIWNDYLPYYKIPQTIDNLLIAYNFGIGNLVKYKQGKIKLPKETRNYLKKYHALTGKHE